MRRKRDFSGNYSGKNKNRGERLVYCLCYLYSRKKSLSFLIYFLKEKFKEKNEIEVNGLSTVCAISTPASVGGISVIRISGEKALEITERVFKPLYPVIKISEMKGYTAAYGRIYDGSLDGERLDDGVLLVFRAPRSYTGEDVCEISCHGGIYVTRRVLTACLPPGGREKSLLPKLQI